MEIHQRIYSREISSSDLVAALDQYVSKVFLGSRIAVLTCFDNGPYNSFVKAITRRAAQKLSSARALSMAAVGIRGFQSSGLK